MRFALWDRFGLRLSRLGNRTSLFLRLRTEGCRHHDRSRRCHLRSSMRVERACNISVSLHVNGCLRRLGFIHMRGGS
ncbi:hypothetical protein AO826_19180 [Xanthomonas phaseoli pv. manihotis]|nr:hypothetical protein AO826_19180 [Xanthomonas phaseoli pv. manihotis]